MQIDHWMASVNIALVTVHVTLIATCINLKLSLLSRVTPSFILPSHQAALKINRKWSYRMHATLRKALYLRLYENKQVKAESPTIKS